LDLFCLALLDSPEPFSVVGSERGLITTVGLWPLVLLTTNSTFWLWVGPTNCSDSHFADRAFALPFSQFSELRTPNGRNSHSRISSCTPFSETFSAVRSGRGLISTVGSIATTPSPELFSAVGCARGLISTVRSRTYAAAFPKLLQNRSWPSIQPSVSSESISAIGSCFSDSRMTQCLLRFVRPRPRTSTIGSRPPLDMRRRICFLLKALSTPLRLRSPRFSELRTPNGSVWGLP